MKKNGFTLVELLAVVTIIALISVLAVPNILGGINRKKGEINDVNKKLIEAAANIYIDRNINLYDFSIDDGSTYCIVLQELVNSDLLSTPIMDISGSEVDYSKFVMLTYDFGYNTFLFDGELRDGSSCT